MNKILFLLMNVVVFSLITVNAIIIQLPTQEVNLNKEFQVPIIVREANNLGSLDLVISYDPNVLELINVKKGKDFRGLISSSTEQEGIVALGIISSDGFTGEGEIAVITFKGINTGSSKLNILSSNAYDASNHVDIKVEYKNGEINVKKSTIPSNNNIIVIVSIAVILIILLTFTYFFFKKKK